MTADQVLEVLQEAGLHVTLAPKHLLRVKPSSNLTADLRDLIRGSKEILIDRLTAANDASVQARNPPDSPQYWKELAAAYYVHHFKCPTCIAAGRGTQYGWRCAAGLGLWNSYIDADELQTRRGDHGQA